MIRRLVYASAMLTFLVSAAAIAREAAIVIMPDQVKWGPAKGFPAGWEAAVLAGNPAKRGPFVERLKLPPNATVPPHTHPIAENVTVISGSLGVGLGRVVDKSKGQMLSAGAFVFLPANTPHFAWAGPEGAVLQIHGYGPEGIKMIRSAAAK